MGDPAQPFTVGVNVTFSSKLCPTGKVRGRLTPDTEKVELPTVIPEMFTLVPSLFVTTTGRLSDWPTTMSPNLRSEGEYESFAVPANAHGIIPQNRTTIPTARKFV